MSYVYNRLQKAINRRFFKGYPFKIYKNYQNLLKKNGFNLCWNKFIKRDYDPSLNNILLALESPAVMEEQGWMDPEMKFVAEVSFGNFYKLENYYCCRTLYTTNDFFVDLNLSKDYSNKSKLVSFVYSDKVRLPGHKFRHELAMNKEVSSRVDMFGSGMGRLLTDKKESLDDYMFQVVIENCKHPDYVSEKFFDCLKTNTLPVYWGAEESLKKMGFDPEGYLSFDSLDELNQIISEKINKTFYQESLLAVNNNKERLIELRKEKNIEMMISPILLKGYFQTWESYHTGKYNSMSFHI